MGNNNNIIKIIENNFNEYLKNETLNLKEKNIEVSNNM